MTTTTTTTAVSFTTVLVLAAVCTTNAFSHAPVSGVRNALQTAPFKSSSALAGFNNNNRGDTMFRFDEAATNQRNGINGINGINGMNGMNNNINGMNNLNGNIDMNLNRSDEEMLNEQVDRTIMRTAIPSMINGAVVPLVNAVDTYWVGRMGLVLALAGQSAANTAFFTLFFLASFLPTITAPLVAEAIGSGDREAARDRISESLFLCNFLGALGTIAMIAYPMDSLKMVVAERAPVMRYAIPYLKLRAISLIPSLLSATGFAAYRGMLNTVTPLKITFWTNVLNLILDPLLIYNLSMGYKGAAAATAAAEMVSGLVYVRLLMQKRLTSVGRMLTPPPLANLWPIFKGGFSVLVRQAALNASFLVAARRAQALDRSGVAGAAFGIVMQLYSIGIVVHVGMQGTAAALVSGARSRYGDAAARKVGNRMLWWSTLVGLGLGAAQYFALDRIIPLFTKSTSVIRAARVPAAICSLIHVVNGPGLVGEGIMLGVGAYKDLALLTMGSVGTMIYFLTQTALGDSLTGIMKSIGILTSVLAGLTVQHHLSWSPLRKRNYGNGYSNGNGPYRNGPMY